MSLEVEGRCIFSGKVIRNPLQVIWTWQIHELPTSAILVRRKSTDRILSELHYSASCCYNIDIYVPSFCIIVDVKLRINAENSMSESNLPKNSKITSLTSMFDFLKNTSSFNFMILLRCCKNSLKYAETSCNTPDHPKKHPPNAFKQREIPYFDGC